MERRNRNGYPFLFVIMFLFFLFTYHIIVPISANNSPYVPEDNIILHCGSSTTLSSTFELSKVSKASIDNPIDPEFLKTFAWIFRTQFSYTLPVSPGPKFIRLHFYPTSYSDLNISKALFTVSIGNYTLLSTSKSSHSRDSFVAEYTIKEYCVHIDGRILNLTFTPSSDYSDAYGFVNKIEVVSMPPNLYIQDVGLPLIGHAFQFCIGKSTALEMMYRVNVGGPSIPAKDDTSMFRSWSRDDDYLSSTETDTAILQSKLEINYSSLVPAYTAPSKVYATARAIFEGKNMTWSFPTDSGFRYLIRLHFCEITPDSMLGTGMVLQVFINNQTRDDHAEIIHLSDGVGVPAYRDYIINFSTHSRGIQYLWVTIGSNTSILGYSEAILNGLEIFKLSDTSNNLAGQNPFSLRKISHHFPENHLKMRRIVAGSLSGILIIFMVCFCLTNFPFGWCSRIIWQRKTFMQWKSSERCRQFSFTEIKSATNNFSDAHLIGAGGFGKVYKGFINDIKTTVAIKRANPNSCQGLNEFQTEITVLSKLRHHHLVSLIGCCLEDKEMILVYNFMARGTLRDHLYKTKKPPLPWKQRLKICIGAARGLHYLHTGAKYMIIHRDVKTTNILLDKNWVARVSDFGLSKIGPNTVTQSNTHVSTLVKGTFGYLDPEYYRRQKLTEKSDVYAFGVVLFEVLCARPAVLPMGEIEEEENEKVNLAEWAIHCYQSGTLDQIVDPYLQGKIDPGCFRKFTDIARKCLAYRGSGRPSMGDVLWNLELAWQQQEGADLEEECRCVGNNDGMGGDLSVKIDCQQYLSVYNSDPTPGAEFSEIMVSVGR